MPAEPVAQRRAAAAHAEAEPADLGLERLRAEPDPRRAVIGAYALMDRVMADRALGRRRSEAPLEYLGRMTAAGYARITALGRLTRLYARARFSTHPIDRSDAGRGGRRRRDHRSRGRRVTATSAILLAAGAVVAVALLPPVPAGRAAPEAQARGAAAPEGPAGDGAPGRHGPGERGRPARAAVPAPARHRPRPPRDGRDRPRPRSGGRRGGRSGPETWELVRGDRPPPDDRHGPGAALADVRERRRPPRADRRARGERRARPRAGQHALGRRARRGGAGRGRKARPSSSSCCSRSWPTGTC